MDSMIWFAITGILIASEVLVGSFYLLALSMGSLAAGLVAYFGYGLENQLWASIIFASMAVLLVWFNRRQRRVARQVDDPDIGQEVVIVQLQPLVVNYRGIQWQAEWRDRHRQSEIGARHHICEKHANLLVID